MLSAKVQGVTLGVAVGECRGKVFQLGEARVLEEPAVLMLKPSKMMAGLEWRKSVSWRQSPQGMKGGK